MMKSNIKFYLIIIIASCSAIISSCTSKTDYYAVIITGQNSHNWQRSSVSIKSILEKSNLFIADITAVPQREQDRENFQIDFSIYDLVVLDYRGANLPGSTGNQLLEFVANGGGLVVFQNSINAFENWNDYYEMIGIDITGDNPYTGNFTGSYKTRLSEVPHSVTQGMPEVWTSGEFNPLQYKGVPGNNTDILAKAEIGENQSSSQSSGFPSIMVHNYGQGKVFIVLTAVSGPGPFIPSMECAGFITIFQRGAEWAVRNKVSQKIPSGIPSEKTPVHWIFFEDIDQNFSATVKKLREYTTGVSDEPFVILKELIRRDIEDQSKIDIYRSAIKDLLKSGKTTVDTKRKLLTDFSWIADKSYIKIIDQLSSNPDLAEHANFAMEIIKMNNP